MSKRDNIAMGGGVDDPIPQQSRTIERQCTIIKRILAQRGDIIHFRGRKFIIVGTEWNMQITSGKYDYIYNVSPWYNVYMYIEYSWL